MIGDGDTASGRARLGGPLECTLPRPEARARLVCFPHAGGSATVYRRWASQLAPDVELWGATLPGRGAREQEPFARDWAPLVDELAAAVAGAVASPFAFWGHSLGALLAFEVARALAARDAAPMHLFASARNAPDPSFSFHVPRGDDALVEQMDATYGGVPDVVRAEPELLRYFLRFLRADLELLSAYRFTPGPPLDCPIMAVAGDADATVSQEQLERWAGETTAGFELRRFPGGHFFVEDNQAAVLQAIRERIVVRR